MRAFLLVHRPSRTVHQSILSNLDAISSELLCLRALSTAPKGKSEAVHRFLPKAHHKKNPAPPAASSNAGKSSSAQHAAEEARAATEQSRSAGSPSSAPGAPPKTAPKGYFWKENSGNKGNQAHGVSQPSRFATSTPPQQPLSAGQQPAFLPPNSKFRRPQVCVRTCIELLLASPRAFARLELEGTTSHRDKTVSVNVGPICPVSFVI